MAKFKDICTKIGSGATPRGGKEAYCEDGISLIRSQNVLDFTFSAGGLVYINELQAEKLKNVIVEEDDVLLNITGDSVARACIVDKNYLPARVNQHVCIIRANSSKVIPSYLLYYLQLNKEYLLQLASGGATRNALTKDMVNNLELELPTVEEQQKIVAVLNDIQKKIYCNNAVNENLEQQLTALFNHIFADDISKASIDTCPMLGDLINVIDNRGKTPPLTTDTIEYPIIDVGALKGAGRIVDFNNCTKYVNKATYETWFRSGHPKSWDILLSTVGSLAELKIHLGTRGCIAQNVVALRAISISPLYLYQYLRFIRADLVAYNIGSVQPSIKVTHIIKHPIFVPEKSILETFEETAKAITQQLYANYNENESLKELRDALLPKLMSGEIDISKFLL